MCERGNRYNEDAKINDDGHRTGGLENRYNITKTNGKPIDTNAQYFVLRIDKDPHALKALTAYAFSVRKENQQFASDLFDKIDEIEKAL